MAFAVYLWLGPAFIARSWFNLETLWAISLVLVGAIGLRLVNGLHAHHHRLHRLPHEGQHALFQIGVERVPVLPCHGARRISSTPFSPRSMMRPRLNRRALGVAAAP